MTKIFLRAGPYDLIDDGREMTTYRWRRTRNRRHLDLDPMKPELPKTSGSFESGQTLNASRGYEAGEICSGSERLQRRVYFRWGAKTIIAIFCYHSFQDHRQLHRDIGAALVDWCYRLQSMRPDFHQY